MFYFHSNKKHKYLITINFTQYSQSDSDDDFTQESLSDQATRRTYLIT